MKRSFIKLLTIELILIIFLVLNIFLINIRSLYLLFGILLVFLALTIALLGFERNRQLFRKEAILSIVTYTLFFQVLIYIIGVFIGFVKTPYSLTLINIFKNVFPVLLIIATSEILRYCIVTKGSKNKLVVVLSAIVFILIDVSLQAHLFDFHIGKDLVELFWTVIIPSISKNILLTYCTTRFGYQSCITYRSIMELPTYILPIFPAIGEYMEAVLLLLLPLLILYVISKHYEEEKEEVIIRSRKYIRIVFKVIFAIFIIIFIALNSRLFKYYVLTIGTGSMEPNISIGDVIIVEKIEDGDHEKLQEGDVIVIKYDGKIISHRIVEIIKENNEYYFKTQGDANDDVDHWTLSEDQVIAKIRAKIKYIGYPSVWLNELIGG